MLRVKSTLGCAVLALAVACGGGGNPPPPPPAMATALAYTDPVSADYRLLGNAALSTPSRLVLDLVGPSSQNGQGLAFILTADPAKVSWVQPPNTTGLVQNLAFDPGGAVVLTGTDKGGGALHGAVFRKAGAVPLGQPLARICLVLKANAVPVNTTIGFTLTAGNTLSDTGTVLPLTLATGTLVAK
ncbi:MAG: hypothetical protein HXX12_12655 [Geothrix sp.]|uniref:hypothetical protein n=1 Tax=Geothrix sp. TaxID=1962974 RepID=UPI0017B85EE9|nr:hypothetical protein [Geothrix sp.]NWJ41805.1 hypothetical protein [Geothrix sp.]WIL20217.1 MAG: hypothetical protein QOZ81_002770 [Geothrix sp.]